MGRADRGVEGKVFRERRMLGKAGSELVLDRPDELCKDAGDGGALPLREAQRLRERQVGGSDGKPLARGGVEQPRVVVPGLMPRLPLIGHRLSIAPVRLNCR